MYHGPIYGSRNQPFHSNFPVFAIYLDLSGGFRIYLDLSGRRCFQNAVKRNVVASSVDPVWANPLTDDTVVGNNKVNRECKWNNNNNTNNNNNHNNNNNDNNFNKKMMVNNTLLA